MKKLITFIIVIILLAGCSGKKNDDSSSVTKPELTAVKPVTKDPFEEFYGTWRTSAIYANGARFNREQLQAMGGLDTFDLIFVFNKDGSVAAYSAYYNQIETEEWTKGENNDSIILGDMELFIEEDEIVMIVDEEKLYMEKISDRQDRDYLNELAAAETKEEETQPTEEPESKPEQEESSVSENTIRPEVKEAIDAYESFIDEYCEFMKKYSESDGTDLSILTDYVTFMAKLEDYSDKMDVMEDDLTDAEYWYYIEVLNRCNEKLLKASRS